MGATVGLSEVLWLISQMAPEDRGLLIEFFKMIMHNIALESRRWNAGSRP